MEVDARDCKAKVTFNRLTMYVPTVICGYYSSATNSYETPLYADELDNVKPVFMDLADKFGVYLTAPEEKW